jgi:hypothetical protein
MLFEEAITISRLAARAPDKPWLYGPQGRSPRLAARTLPSEVRIAMIILLHTYASGDVFEAEAQTRCYVNHNSTLSTIQRSRKDKAPSFHCNPIDEATAD